MSSLSYDDSDSDGGGGHGSTYGGEMEIDLAAELRPLLPWLNLYYPDWEGDPISNFFAKIRAANSFLQNDQFFVAELRRVGCVSSQCFSYPVQAVTGNVTFMGEWPDFHTDLTSSPHDVFRTFSIASHWLLDQLGARDSVPNVDFDVSDGTQQQEVPIGSTHGAISTASVTMIIQFGFIDPRSSVRLTDINISMLDRFVTCVGRVVSVDNVIPVANVLTFECIQCSHLFQVRQPFGKYKRPRKCARFPECDGESFWMVPNHSENVFTDTRWMTLQDIFEDQSTDRNQGLVPKCYRCLVIGSMIEKFHEFDVVYIGGVLMSTRKKISSTFHDIYIHASAVTVKGGPLFNDSQSITPSDIRLFHALSMQENNFTRLVQSFKPEIASLEMVKAGLLLSLVGGSRTRVDRRYNIHTLLIGDHGIGKSKLLAGVQELSRRGETVVGTGVTPVGLTMTLSKESANYTLRTGAIVRSSGGILCIDEFDKIKEDCYCCLLEGMEQQVVSVAKATVARRVEAKTSIVAAGNPRGSAYNESLTFQTNVKISEALFNRFDLTFVLLDRPSMRGDDAKVIAFMRSICDITPVSQLVDIPSEGPSGEAEQIDLLSKLKHISNAHGPVSVQTLSNYLEYVKQNFSPKLDPSAQQYVIEQYMRLRSMAPVSRLISTRQLESMIRLTQARAKIDLSSIARCSHAKDAIEIFFYAFESTVTGPDKDGSNALPNDDPIGVRLGTTGQRVRTRTGRALREAEADELKNILSSQSTRTNSGIFTRVRLEALIKAHNFHTNPSVLIELMRSKCVLFRHGDDSYRYQP